MQRANKDGQGPNAFQSSWLAHFGPCLTAGARLNAALNAADRVGPVAGVGGGYPASQSCNGSSQGHGAGPCGRNCSLIAADQDIMNRFLQGRVAAQIYADFITQGVGREAIPTAHGHGSSGEEFDANVPGVGTYEGWNGYSQGAVRHGPSEAHVQFQSGRAVDERQTLPEVMFPDLRVQDRSRSRVHAGLMAPLRAGFMVDLRGQQSTPEDDSQAAIDNAGAQSGIPGHNTNAYTLERNTHATRFATMYEFEALASNAHSDTLQSESETESSQQADMQAPMTQREDLLEKARQWGAKYIWAPGIWDDISLKDPGRSTAVLVRSVEFLSVHNGQEESLLTFSTDAGALNRVGAIAIGELTLTAGNYQGTWAYIFISDKKASSARRSVAAVREEVSNVFFRRSRRHSITTSDNQPWQLIALPVHHHAISRRESVYKKAGSASYLCTEWRLSDVEVMARLDGNDIQKEQWTAPFTAMYWGRGLVRIQGRTELW